MRRRRRRRRPELGRGYIHENDVLGMRTSSSPSSFYPTPYIRRACASCFNMRGTQHSVHPIPHTTTVGHAPRKKNPHTHNDFPYNISLISSSSSSHDDGEREEMKISSRADSTAFHQFSNEIRQESRGVLYCKNST